MHHPLAPTSMATLDVPTAICTLLICIDMCVVIMSMYITSTDARNGVLAHRKKLRVGLEVSGHAMAHMAYTQHDSEEEELEHPHAKQVLDLLAWYVGVLDAKWYVKPRSICWFEEYIFNIYTPNMFYDILP
jgi:hypothetical protein